MSDDMINRILERLEELSYDVSKLESRIDAVENELRLTVHEQAPQLIEMRQELMQMKKAVETFSEPGDRGIPIEALQPPPRR